MTTCTHHVCDSTVKKGFRARRRKTKTTKWRDESSSGAEGPGATRTKTSRAHKTRGSIWQWPTAPNKLFGWTGLEAWDSMMLIFRGSRSLVVGRLMERHDEARRFALKIRLKTVSVRRENFKQFELSCSKQNCCQRNQRSHETVRVVKNCQKRL
jgi:hypothetical protein